MKNVNVFANITFVRAQGKIKKLNKWLMKHHAMGHLRRKIRMHVITAIFVFVINVRTH